MALKRNYQTGTKYLYAKVLNFNYSKESTKNISVGIFERDSEDAVYNLQIGDALNFNVLPYDSDFSIEQLNILNNNIIKAAYTFIKAHIDLFRDFEDC